MKNHFTIIKYLSIICFLGVYSCQEKGKEKSSKYGDTQSHNLENNSHLVELDTFVVLKLEEKQFKFEKWKDKFKFQHKTNCFGLDSIESFENIINQPDYDWNQYSQVITGNLLRQIEDEDTVRSWHDDIREETDFLYSIQETKKFIGITIIGGNDSWVNEIRYLTFDLKGNKLADIVLASKGGDGGYYLEGQGCFLNDSIYEYNYLDTEFNFDNKRTDTLSFGKVLYRIKENGLIERVSPEPDHK